MGKFRLRAALKPERITEPAGKQLIQSLGTQHVTVGSIDHVLRRKVLAQHGQGSVVSLRFNFGDQRLQLRFKPRKIYTVNIEHQIADEHQRSVA